MSDTRWLSADEIAAHLGVGKDLCLDRKMRSLCPPHRKILEISKRMDNEVKSGKLSDKIINNENPFKRL